MPEDHEWTVQEAGRKGGITTKNYYGSLYFQAIGKDGGTRTRRRGREYYVGIGRKGQLALRRKIIASRPDLPPEEALRQFYASRDQKRIRQQARLRAMEKEISV